MKQSQKSSMGQMNLWEDWKLPLSAIQAVAKQFVLANCFNPDLMAARFTDTT